MTPIKAKGEVQIPVKKVKPRKEDSIKLEGHGFESWCRKVFFAKSLFEFVHLIFVGCLMRIFGRCAPNSIKLFGNAMTEGLIEVKFSEFTIARKIGPRMSYHHL